MGCCIDGLCRTPGQISFWNQIVADSGSQPFLADNDPLSRQAPASLVDLLVPVWTARQIPHDPGIVDARIALDNLQNVVIK